MISTIMVMHRIMCSSFTSMYLTSINNANGNMSNIIGNGFTVYYYAGGNKKTSSSLGRLTYNLTNGSYLMPIMITNNQIANAFVPSSGVQFVSSATSDTSMGVSTSTSPFSSSTTSLTMTTTSYSSGAVVVKDRFLSLNFILSFVMLYIALIIF
jgi:hypothetical protein